MKAVLSNVKYRHESAVYWDLSVCGKTLSLYKTFAVRIFTLQFRYAESISDWMKQTANFQLSVSIMLKQKSRCKLKYRCGLSTLYITR